MTDNASSSRPGFSYRVGVTDNTWSKLANFKEAGSCGGEGKIGRFLSDEGGREGCSAGVDEACWAGEGGGGGDRDGCGGRCPGDRCDEGTGDCVRDLARDCS